MTLKLARQCYLMLIIQKTLNALQGETIDAQQNRIEQSRAEQKRTQQNRIFYFPTIVKVIM